MALTPQSHSWHAFPKGTRVLDTVSGMDGLVTGTRLVHAVEPARSGPGDGAPGRLIPLPNPVVHETVIVKLDDGSTVERSPRVLLGI